MAELDSDQRGWQPKHQLDCRTDFGLQLIAHRLTDAGSQLTKTLVGNDAKPKPAIANVATTEKINIPRSPAENARLDLDVELEAQEAQKRLITKVALAATTIRPIFERVIEKPPPIDKLPYIKSCTQKADKIINKWWSLVFYDPKLRGLAGNCRVAPANSKYGLVYLYVVGSHVRYVGRTIYSLHWRMTKRQGDGGIGYPRPIKRNLLNAFRDGTLSIETEMAKRTWIDRLEQNVIHHFAPTNRLWNREYNPHFNSSNYWA